MSGAGCESGLYCEVTGADLMGTCTEPPAECGSSLDCGESACKAAVQASCGTASVHCLGLIGDYTVGCESSPPPRAAGEECSVVYPCVEGTYCDIKDVADVGTCVELPAECGGEASCTCLQPVIDACSDGHACHFVNGAGFVACT